MWCVKFTLTTANAHVQDFVADPTRVRFNHSPMCLLAVTDPIDSSSSRFLAALALLAAIGGCDPVPPRVVDSAPADKGSADCADGGTGFALTTIHAQGVLKPAGGVLPLLAPPGDRVESVRVEVGQQIDEGQLLVELASYRAREIELDVARQKIVEGEQRIAAETSAAEAKLEIAEIGLEQARTRLQQARDQFGMAEASGGRLDLLRQAAELGERKLEQLQDARSNETTRRLISANQIDEESLKVSQARSLYQSAVTDSTQAIRLGELAVESAEQEIRAAQLAINATLASNAVGALKRQVKLLELNLETSRLVSPIGGHVLTMDCIEGQATTAVPLMRLADTSNMVCEAEVNVGDLARVAQGQAAKICSPGLDAPIAGRVERIEPLVSTPSLANPFPMARVDRHAAKVIITIDQGDTAEAARLIQLQVEVTIDTDGIDRADVASATSDETPAQ